jgi:hypothetical protein
MKKKAGQHQRARGLFRDAALIFEGPVIAKEDMREDYAER